MIFLRTVCVSAHLDSFCRRLNERAGGQFKFVYTRNDPGEIRRRCGWSVATAYESVQDGVEQCVLAESCPLVIDMLREVGLFESRVMRGLKTIYVSERWLKPLVIKGVRLPGILKLLSPSYFAMVRRFVRLMDAESFYVFPIGVHAMNDFVRLYEIMHGRLLALCRPSCIKLKRTLGESVPGFPRLHLWAYFVDPYCACKDPLTVVSCPPGVKKILWCGRMLDWKRVDVLIRAFSRVSRQQSMALLLVGEGPERANLKELAGDLAAEGLGWWPGKVAFSGYVKCDQVRELMRMSDVYVMPSNAEEGWGAAVSDALVVGTPVISTKEAGSSATLLPNEMLYPAADERALARLLAAPPVCKKDDYCSWNGAHAADALLDIVSPVAWNQDEAKVSE